MKYLTVVLAVCILLIFGCDEQNTVQFVVSDRDKDILEWYIRIPIDNHRPTSLILNPEYYVLTNRALLIECIEGFKAFAVTNDNGAFATCVVVKEQTEEGEEDVRDKIE